KTGGASTGTVEASGTAGPLKPGTPPAMPLTAHVKLEDVDIAPLQPPKSTTQGLLSGVIEIDSNGVNAKASGTAKILKLKARPKGQPATIPVDVKFDTDYTPRTEVLHLKVMNIIVGSAQAH